MIKVSVTTRGLMELKAELMGKGKQFRFAAAQSLNQAAYAAAEATKQEMVRVFKSPTPWVLGGVRYIKANKDTLTAKVDFDRWGNKRGYSVANVLAAEIDGGSRKNKGFEVALQRAGILPNGMQIVPGDAARLDQYGNMSAAQIVQIIAWFRAFGEQGYKANMDDAGRRRLGRGKAKGGARGFAYFVLHQRRGKLAPGIYQRFGFAWGSAVKPVMIFVRKAVYQKRFDFYGHAEKVARAEYDRVFDSELRRAIASAK